jgi:hypothetical protein
MILLNFVGYIALKSTADLLTVILSKVACHAVAIGEGGRNRLLSTRCLWLIAP